MNRRTADGFIGTELVNLLPVATEVLSALTKPKKLRQTVARAARARLRSSAMAIAQPVAGQSGGCWVFHFPAHSFTGRASAGNGRHRSRASRCDGLATCSTPSRPTPHDASFTSPTRIATGDERSRHHRGRTASARPRGDVASRRHWIVSTVRAAGLPIVTAFPGSVYGNGSWFATGDQTGHGWPSRSPVWKDRTVVCCLSTSTTARACWCICAHGEAGRRVFRGQQRRCGRASSPTFARLANLPLRHPAGARDATRLMAGAVWPITSTPTPCTRTFDCAASVSVSPSNA